VIIDLHEKYDVSPEWFEEQAKREPQAAWTDKLSELLSVYRVNDPYGAEEAAKRMKAAGIDGEMIRAAME